METRKRNTGFLPAWRAPCGLRGAHAEETGEATTPDEQKQPLVIPLQESFLYAHPLFQISSQSSQSHSFLIYNLHFFYCLNNWFFFFPSALSHFADLRLSCTFHNTACLPSLVSCFMKRLSHQFSLILVLMPTLPNTLLYSFTIPSCGISRHCVPFLKRFQNQLWFCVLCVRDEGKAPPFPAGLFPHNLRHRFLSFLTW